MSIALFLVTVIVAPALLLETLDWLPWTAEHLIRRATRALPPESQDRYLDEWLGELDALPGGNLTKVAFGCRLYAAAPCTGAALRGTPSTHQASVKNLLDPIAATVAFLITLPVWVVIACAIRFTSPGPVVFRQRRTGQDGSEFTILKFRTMYVGAERGTVGPHSPRAGYDPVFNPNRDPRITRVGSFLRRYSFDELPQLLNVMAGSMSLVGPRPSLPEETATDSPEVLRRLLVKPGLTGMWQVKGRQSLPWEEAVRLDLSYVDNWSLGLDLRILLMTPYAVLRGQREENRCGRGGGAPRTAASRDTTEASRILDLHPDAEPEPASGDAGELA